MGICSVFESSSLILDWAEGLSLTESLILTAGQCRVLLWAEKLGASVGPASGCWICQVTTELCCWLGWTGLLPTLRRVCAAFGSSESLAWPFAFKRFELIYSKDLRSVRPGPTQSDVDLVKLNLWPKENCFGRSGPRYILKSESATYIRYHINS